MVDEHETTDPSAVVRSREYERIRTEVECTECQRVFVTQLDASVDGNHRVICPYCGHLHWREIRGGKITDVRWGSGLQTVDAEGSWKHRDVPDSDPLRVEAAAVSTFLRNVWVDRFGAR